MPDTTTEADLLHLLQDMLHDKQERIDHLTTQVAKLTMHHDSIRLMRRNLTRLTWWQYRRRRNIEFQLAQIALTLGE
jgi:septal ring factor EnvC (AmiA/AmiB activator)